jgi:ATP-dependent RNA helicase DDX46/PRP5
MQVGARSTVGSTITQIIEIRDTDDERFARLLEILGQWGEAGKILVFVNSQDKASELFQKLLNYGHPNMMLHGDMQQVRLRHLQ